MKRVLLFLSGVVVGWVVAYYAAWIAVWRHFTRST